MNDRYQSPLSERYASKEMQYIFSPDKKFKTWRKLWIALAETEKELGLDITQEQIDELKAHAEDINYDVAKEREKLVRHDVMSHVYAYGVQCPKAKGIIHLGATSCYVGDNTDIIIMTEALKLVRVKLLNVINELSKFAMKYKDLPTLGFTHFQPAQPTTVGKRASLWLMDLVYDLEDLDHVIANMRLLGSKGTTGTQASFLELFEGNHETIKKIDGMIAKKMGFDKCQPVSGQTYSRKVDSRVINVLSQIAQSAHKFSNDIRLLQHLKEVEEPFEKNQIGSSAMAYKRNPVGRPPKYKSVEEIQGKIDAYFTACKGHPLMNPDTGEPFQDKYGLPIIVDAKPPTVSGLALALGFSCRRDLNAYQGKKEFCTTITRAKAQCEAYAEERLFDRDGTNGAQFSLRCNFGWNDKPAEAPPPPTDDGFLTAMQQQAPEAWKDGADEPG